MIFKPFGFGNGAIREDEFEFLKSFIEENSIRTFLEIGAGYSTFALNQIESLKVKTYETDKNWINKVLEYGHFDIVEYKYPVFPEDNNIYDMALVDGPSSGYKNYEGRIHSMIFAKNHAKYIAVHDFSRTQEKESVNKVFPNNNIVGKKSSLIIFS